MNNGKVCVSICAIDTHELNAKIMRAETLADVIEVRFDCLDPSEVETALTNLPEISKTYLFTFRPDEQGGNRKLSLKERLKFWEKALRIGPKDLMIDIEFEPAILLAIDPDKTERIVSYHDFAANAGSSGDIWSAITNLSDGIVKIAVSADDITDAIAVWKLIETANHQGRRVIPIAMGDVGKWTRILGPAHGAFMTYASLESGAETADGQVSAPEMSEVYRVKQLSKQTSVYGVIGDPVSSSLSPYFQNATFASQEIDAVFLPLAVKNVERFIRRMVAPASREVELNFAGFSVTMPHKQAIIPFLDEVDATAKAIGAVNTVKVVDEKLYGYNTDAEGFIRPLRAKLGKLDGCRVAVFGAGGAARAAVYALNTSGASPTLFARDSAKAADFAQEFKVPFNVISDNLSGSNATSGLAQNFDVIVNATPMGMRGDLENLSILNAEQIRGVKLVYDLVTRAETPLIKTAKAAGIDTIGGIEMLIAQGAEQFEIWTGRPAPIGIIRSVAEAKLGEPQQ